MLGNYMVCFLCTNTSIQSNSDECQPHQLQQCTIEIFWHLWGKGGYKNVFQYFNPSLIFGLQSCTNIVFYFLCVSILESKLDIRPSILYKHCILLFMCFNTWIQAWYSAFNLVQTLYFTFYVFQYLNPSLIFGLQSCTNIIFYFLCVSILESKLDIRPSILYKHCILLFMCFNTLIQAWYSAFNLVQTLHFTFYVFQYLNPSLIFGLQSCTKLYFTFYVFQYLNPSLIFGLQSVQTLYFTFYVFQYFNPSLIFGLQSCTNIVFYFLCVSIL